MKQYKVWVHIEEVDEEKDHYQDLGLPYETGCFENEASAQNFMENELMRIGLSGSAADLLEACKVLTSYTSDLLYRLDNQANLDEIEEIQQAKEAISKYCPKEADSDLQREMTLQEQSPDSPSKTIKLHLLTENGQLWIKPDGYGEKCTIDGEGSPVGIEIWQGHLRLIAFADINSEEPKIIDLENARESNRLDTKE